MLAKTASGGASFVWLCATAGSLLWVPALAAALVAGPGPLGLEALGFMVGSGVLHAAYFVLLQRGYRDGVDVVYVEDADGWHNETTWARRLPGALRFLLAGIVPEGAEA